MLSRHWIEGGDSSAVVVIFSADEVRISLEKIEKPKKADVSNKSKSLSEDGESPKLTSSKLATKLKLKTPELIKMLISGGYVKEVDEKKVLTNKGEDSGGEAKTGRFGPYFIWPENFNPVQKS